MPCGLSRQRFAIGCALMQFNTDGADRVIYYLSRPAYRYTRAFGASTNIEISQTRHASQRRRKPT